MVIYEKIEARCSKVYFRGMTVARVCERVCRGERRVEKETGTGNVKRGQRKR